MKKWNKKRKKVNLFRKMILWVFTWFKEEYDLKFGVLH